MLWWLLACGRSEPAAVQSVPTAPTKEFPKDEPAVVMTDLGDLFPERPAALPTSLAALTPGMEGQAARAVMEANHEPGVKIFGERGEKGFANTTMLREHKNVSFTLLFDGEGRVLQEVDLSLPDEVAVPMLTTRWGAPTEQVAGDGAKMTLRWNPADGPWRAELIPSATRDKAILRYLPR